MANNTRVLNISRGYALKHKQAVKAVENCACAWVEFGVSVRDLTLQEAVAARNERAQRREPLALAELPGIVFRVPIALEPAARLERQLATEANQFARMVTT